MFADDTNLFFNHKDSKHLFTVVNKEHDSIEAVLFEINLRKEKWLVISICRPPSQNSECFLNNLTVMIHFFADTYDNYLTMGDFNIEQSDPSLKAFLNSKNLYNLIKSNTCFNSKGSCIDLFLTHIKYLFKFSGSYETGISDHRHMIYTMLKSCFNNTEPKLLNYRDFKHFLQENLAKLSVIVETHMMILITFLHQS